MIQEQTNDAMSTMRPATSQFARLENWIIPALLVVMVIFNLITAMDVPTVWDDEVMYSDPAANFVLGHGFTSSAWYDQTSEKFWACNTPLHQIALCGWLSLFGFNPLAVRSINYLWFALGTFLVWRACVRMRWIESPWLRIVAVLGLACSSSVSFSYRGGRPDMIGYFLCSAALWAVSLSSNKVRLGLFLALGFLMPWAGMQVLPALVIITGLALFFWGWKAALNGIGTGVGAGLGLAGLYVFYQTHGVWGDFLASLKRHATGPVSIIYGHARLEVVPAMMMRDRSAPFLLALAAMLVWWCWKKQNFAAMKIALFALAAGLCIPIGLHFIGVFPIYYGWMAALPVTLALCHCLSQQPLKSIWVKTMAAVLLVAAAFVGLPLRLAVAELSGDQQPYSAVSAFISGHLKPTDSAYVDYAAFYPAKLSAKKIFIDHYFRTAITPEEKKSINVLVSSPGGLADITNALPGRWTFEAELIASPATSGLPGFLARHAYSHQALAVHNPYQFVIYRRTPEELRPAAE